MSEVRVLIAAGNLLARTGLAALLASSPDVLVVGQVAGNETKTLLDDIDIFRPDVVVYDVDGELSGVLLRLAVLVEAQMPLVALLPDDRSVSSILSTLADVGAFGLLLRESVKLLPGALVAVLAGLVTLDPELTASLIPPADPERPALFAELTPRESDVLQLIAQGLPNKIIALTLEISPNTVKFHVNAILSKLGAQSRTDAVVKATQLGLIVL